jgi:hypothetical protein
MIEQSELAALARRSADLLDALESALKDVALNPSIRTDVAVSTSNVAIEHGVSIVSLAGAGHLSSASVLLRTQFEAVTRALWLAFAANQSWLDDYLGAAGENPHKDPKAPRMDEMLADISKNAPASIAPQLTRLKEYAWGPLNSFVHSGVHPTTLQRVGYPLRAVTGTIMNSNALTTLAFATIAVFTGDKDLMKRLSGLQLQYRDCLPPLHPPPGTA